MGYNVNDNGNIQFNTKSSNRHIREIGLQNKVVDNILKVTRSPKNQINLHMPIDMGVAQKAAEGSAAGEAVKHVTADDPFVKYMMQVQNMVGKQVIGITAVSIKAFFAATTHYNNIINNFTKELSVIPKNSNTEIQWARVASNNYEVSSKGDKRFSALYATFKPGTIIDGVDVSGRTIEDVYQHVIKKSGKGRAPSKDSKLYNESLKTQEEREDFSYTNGYFPLWQEWARQNPELIEELRQKSTGKVLTDQFANTRVSQARALTDILNSSTLPQVLDKKYEELIYHYLKEILLINPLSGEVTCYANLNFDKIIDLVDNNPVLKNYVINRERFLPNTRIWQGLARKDNNPLTLSQLLHTLRIKSMSNDTTLSLSALLSSATDNAKELILSKINATSKFVDIYTYCLTLGIPFNQIADIMKSPIFNEVVKLTESNIFNKDTFKYNLESALDFYINKKILPGVDKDVLNLVSHKKLNGLNDYRAALDEAYRLLNASKYVDPMQAEEIRSEIEQMGDQGNVSRVFALEPATNQELLAVIDYLNKLIDRDLFLQKLENNAQSSLNTLKLIRNNIIPAMEEMELLGAMLGINQGQKTNDYDQYSFINRIENFINGRYKKAKFDHKFDLMKFLSDPTVRQSEIELYDKVKSTYNILDIISTVPHFAAMFNTLELSNSVLNRFSYIYKLERSVISQLKDIVENFTVNDKIFKTIRDTLYDQTIVDWIKSQNLKIKLPADFKYIEGTPDHFETTSKRKPITLDSTINIANFKKLMDEDIIPKIISAYPKNHFAKALTRAIKEDSVTGLPKFQWRLVLQMMNIADSQQTQTMYENILSDFDAIANHKINGWKIPDLFYLYNLIVNKDAFGNDSFTRVFENLITSKNSSGLINSFYQYVSDLDNDFMKFDINMNNINYRLSKLPNSKVKTRPNMYKYNPEYFTFDLPFDSDDSYIMQVKSTNLVIPTDTQSQFKSKITKHDILIPYVNLIKDKLGVNIHLVTNQNTNENERAFIQDGEFYINVDKADITDIFHELGHGIFATLKRRKPSVYYNMMSIATQSSKFQEIAQFYPDKHGSDLQEEVLLKLLQMEMKGYAFSNTKLITDNIPILDIVHNIITDFRDSFGESVSREDLKTIPESLSILTTTILDIIDNQKRTIDKGLILDSQKVATIKDNFVKSELLTEDCSKI